MEEGKISFKILKINLQERGIKEDLGTDEMTKVESMLKKQKSIRGIGLIWFRIGITGEPL